MRLRLLILIEIVKAGREKFYLSEFFKGEYWDVDDIVSEVMDTNDYDGISDMVLGQIKFIIEDLRIGKIVSVGIDNMEGALSSLAEKIHKIIPSENPHTNMFDIYGMMMSDYAELYCEAKAERNRQIEKDPSGWFKRPPAEIVGLPINFDPSIYFEKLKTVIIETPERIVIHAVFNAERVAEIEAEISRYMAAFADDLSDTSPYRKSDIYFTKQIENFFGYITKLPVVGNTIHVPFEILKERGFEAVKILCYLQMKKAISLKWSDGDSWRVSFARTPITISHLLGETNGVIDPTPIPLKTNLSFAYEKGELIIGDYGVKIRGVDQKELLRIIFADPAGPTRQWFFSEIAEEYDHADNIGNKKFYNAAYQVNKKIAEKTPIKDFLITTNQTVDINPKYHPKP